MQTTQGENGQKTLNEHLIDKKIPKAKHMKSCSILLLILLLIKKLQIKSTMRHHFTITRLTTILYFVNIKC